MAILILFVAGWLIWSISEYLYNRFVFHEGTFLGLNITTWKEHHDKHHRYPTDERYILFPASLLIISSLALLSVFWLLFSWLSFSLLAGFLSGYLVFIFLHYFQHTVKLDKPNFLFRLWRQHYLHHTVYPDTAFGVSTTFWDTFFNSSPSFHQFLQVDLTEKKSAQLTVLPVTDSVLEEAFYSVPSAIYQNDPYWVQPFNRELKSVFDENVNPFFKHGISRRWVLIRDNEVIGRIAAFVDYEKMVEDGKRIGKIGFFESVNSKEAADALFRAACSWLWQKYAIDTVEGPVNFGENDKFWGLRISGSDTPSYGMNYNPDYYIQLFGQIGFKEHYRQLTNKISLKNPLPHRFQKIAERVEANEKYSFIPFSWKEKERFIKDFVTIYNKAWADFKNFTPLSEEYLRQSLLDLKPVMEEDFIWFAYVRGEPAGLVVGVPDVNEALSGIKGDFNWKNKLKFLAFKTFKGFSRARVIIMGIVPEFQRLGLESALILKSFQAGQKKPGYKEVLLAWVGDFNEKMIAIHNAMNAVPHTVHATFRLDLTENMHLKNEGIEADNLLTSADNLEEYHNL